MATQLRRQHAMFLLVTAVAALLVLSTVLAFVSALRLADTLSFLTGVTTPNTEEDAVAFYNELLSRKVANPSDLPDPGPIDEANLRKGPGGPWTDGPYTYFCGVFNTGIPSTIRSGSLSLRVVNITYFAPANSCLRVYCYDTSAIYFCNNLASNLTIPGYDIGWMADRLALLCCDSHHATSAQLFHPTEGWNTVVGYGNCRHDPTEPPSSFGVGDGGINGDCIPNESRPNPGSSPS